LIEIGPKKDSEGSEAKLEREVEKLRRDLSTSWKSNQETSHEAQELKLEHELSRLRDLDTSAAGRSRKKSEELIAIENDISDQLSRITQYVKSGQNENSSLLANSDKYFRRPLSSPVIMSALMASFNGHNDEAVVKKSKRAISMSKPPSIADSK
jgi:hypothetical protein